MCGASCRSTALLHRLLLPLLMWLLLLLACDDDIGVPEAAIASIHATKKRHSGGEVCGHRFLHVSTHLFCVADSDVTAPPVAYEILRGALRLKKTFPPVYTPEPPAELQHATAKEILEVSSSQ